ncbi:MAG: hypothetical protein PW845_02010 [Pseudomonas sp.]|uniref:hypothetical protein n=1 Tax=Pseudomonas abieticivorans TaxID=2931382 RepID=UPI0020C0E2C6|nr:hypothetical protein [Pseudomonas sp. PIA16]MDE1164168.1 hypothetical protein [Pseudomonas sp.]
MKLTIKAGDFLQCDGDYRDGSLTLKTIESPSPGEKIPVNRIKHITVANHETSRSLGGALGWGVAGALVLGPVGLVAGLWLGGKEEEVTFVATFKDGRKLTAVADSRTFNKLNDRMQQA